MVQIRENAIQELSPRIECRHHWIIESANGPTSWGVCKYCGTEKQFTNSLPDSLKTWDRSLERLEVSRETEWPEQ